MKQFISECVRYIKILAGSIVYAIGISLFLDPNDLAPGGVTGISILLNRLTSIEVGTLAFMINIPILILGWWQLGRKMALSTIVAVGLSSIAMNVISLYGVFTKDKLLAATVGGVLVASGIGTVFKAGGTTGGMDIIIRCIRKKYPYLKTGMMFMLTDFIVIALSAVVFRNFDIALYAGISSVVNSYVLDLVLYGRDEAKLLFVISDSEKEIVRRILGELDIGVTQLQGVGAFTGNEKKIIMCVMRKQSMPKVREIVEEIDDSAFMIVSSANEIYGEGYKTYHGMQL